MKRLAYLLAVSLFLCSTPTQAQHFEAGVVFGTSGYSGDLISRGFPQYIQSLRLAGGVFGRYNFNDHFSARAGVNIGSISGSDFKGKEEFEVNRQLEFESSLFEANLLAEFNILGYQPYNLERVFSPYIFGGIAVFRYNPKATLNGQTFELQPLSTEGQGTSQFPDRETYSLTQFAVPLGFGFKFALNDRFNIGIEGGIRVTFTDYLDDVSQTYADPAILLEERGEIAVALASPSNREFTVNLQRGSSVRNDYYGFAGVTLSMNFLDNGLVGIRFKSRRKSGCPTF